MIYHCGFQSAERKIKCVAAQRRGGEFYPLDVSRFRGKLVHFASARIRKTDNTSYLVECFSGGIVTACADLLKGGIPGDAVN